jgi:hypothetical protein
MTPKDILKFYKRLEMEAETLIRLVGALNEGSE